MTEIRRNRASFTKTLEAMCKRLDDNPGAEMVWEHPLVHIDFTSDVSIKSLWIVGSYARGAPTCGDLDMVAEMIVHTGPPPPPYEVAKALFRSPKGVSMYLGTPQENTSCTAFPEAVLIWAGAGHDWQRAIASIAIDPSAGHFSRPTDRIPFRTNQLFCTLGELEELLALHDQQVIRWKFLPVGGIEELGELSKDEQELSEFVHQRGRKTIALLPQLINYFRQPTTWSQPYLRLGTKNNQFGIGGTKVLVGRPKVPIHELDQLTTSELLIVPHRSARGHNGIWHVERGDQHPLVLVAAKLKVWTLAGGGGQPDFYYHLTKGDPVDSSSARGVDLFTSLSGAQDWIEQDKEDGEPVLIPMELTARELLSCLARADVACIDLKDYAIAHRGMVALGCNDTATNETLIQALAGTAGQSDGFTSTNRKAI